MGNLTGRQESSENVQVAEERGKKRKYEEEAETEKSDILNTPKRWNLIRFHINLNSPRTKWTFLPYFWCVLELFLCTYTRVHVFQSKPKDNLHKY